MQTFRNDRTWYRRFGKRAVDIAASATLLTLFAPLLLAAAAATAVVNRGSVFFLQQRPGKDGKPFTIIKLKTMRDARDRRGKLLPDEERLTLLGSVVRKVSLDELFQLFNVLKGDMSLLGPRPLLMEYLPCYSAQQMRRHEVLPGVSGLAQVKGRNGLSWTRRFRYDVFYVDHLSARLDLWLAWCTVVKIFKADDITPAGVTAEANAFRGNRGNNVPARTSNDTTGALR